YARFTGQLLQVGQVDALDVALDGVGAHGHGAVDPERDLRDRAAFEVAAEVWRYLHGQADIAAAQARVELGVAGQRGTFLEVAGAGDVQQVMMAGGGLITVEYGVAEVLDVEADAVAHDEHE